MKWELSEGTLKKARLVLIGIIVVAFGLGVYSEWRPQKATIPPGNDSNIGNKQKPTVQKPEKEIPPGTIINEHPITFSDLNIGEDIVLCEGSYYCRDVFYKYSKLISKEFGEPGATLYGEAGDPKNRGSFTSGWILGNGYEIILNFKHANDYWKAMGEKPKTTISMLKF